MNALKIAGIIILGIVWLWLSKAVITTGGGWNLKNIFIILASGIIIFVPLWKKYFRNNGSVNNTK